ncbi:MAG: STAS domain-containing protein [Bacteroidia bacterium]|jgi:anti-anti-sigma factor|nr:STAS domain-containing protein [Bacteroidia bacterium]MCC6769441.1 STAS domain-containing protein [Bacteroidia bacterium]
MLFSRDKTEHYTILKVQTDKLDSTVAPELKSEMLLINKEGVVNIILDLSDARYCDSSGLSSILVGNRLCKNGNGILVLAGLQPSVMKLITISQLSPVLTITPTVSEAIDYLFMESIEKDITQND